MMIAYASTIWVLHALFNLNFICYTKFVRFFLSPAILYIHFNWHATPLRGLTRQRALIKFCIEFCCDLLLFSLFFSFGWCCNHCAIFYVCLFDCLVEIAWTEKLNGCKCCQQKMCVDLDAPAIKKVLWIHWSTWHFSHWEHVIYACQ